MKRYMWFLALGIATAADQAPRPAQVEQLPPDRFSDAHAPLFQPPKSNEAGVITERVSPSNKSAAAISTPVARRNFVDNFIFAKMEKDAIPHSGLTTDYEFMRRVTLDLTGRIPASQELTDFIADKDPAKRDKAGRPAARQRSVRRQVGLLLHGRLPRQRQNGPRPESLPLLDEGEPARRPSLRRHCALHHRRLGQKQSRSRPRPT